MATYSTKERWLYKREPVLRYLSSTNRWVISEPQVPEVSGTSTTYIAGAHRSVTTRRVRPSGNDLLFSGQSYTRKRVECRMPPFLLDGNKQRYTVVGGGNATYRGRVRGSFNQPSRGFSETDPLYNAPSYTGYASTPDALTYLHLANSTVGRALDNELLLLLKDQKLDMLTNMVELRKTGEMFRELGSPLLRTTSSYVDDLKRYLSKERRRFAGEAALGIPGVRLTKSLANLHLAYVFGVKPLLGELEGAFELLTESERQVVKARSSRVHHYELVRPPFRSIMSNMYDEDNPATLQVTHRGSIRYHYHLYGELDPLYDWRTLTRMGINPLATAWEVLPWSFAIDRLVTIGDSIAAMGALKGYSRTVCYETRVHTQESMRRCNISDIVQYCTRKEVTRTIRPLKWSPPRFVFDYGAPQVVTYTALLRQQLGKWLPLLK